MAISFKKLLKIFDERHITSYVVRQNKIMSQQTFCTLRRNSNSALSTTTIDRICQYLDCQPGDIMEYVADDVDK